jgi:hypothetical protein
MNLPDQLITTKADQTTIATTATRNMSTVLTGMVAIWLKIGRKISTRLHQNRKKEASIVEEISTIKETVDKDEV